jgi:AmiR/NasT family two-component response regulator
MSIRIIAESCVEESGNVKNNGIILGIENAILALDIEKFIRTRGLGNTVICYSCEEVYAMLLSIVPELLVIDVTFENKNEWLELIRHFAAHTPAPVIALTDSYSPREHEELAGAGAIYVLTKPLDRKHLRKSLSDIIKKP